LSRTILYFSCLGLFVIGLWTKSAGQTQAAPGPSFDCAKAKTEIHRAICSDPKLAALDRELADVYTALANQGGTNAAALRKDEDHWIASERNHCTTNDCIAAAYTSRIAALKDQSLREASPAAYAETRPFPITAETWALAHAIVGQACRDSKSALAVQGMENDPVMPLPVIFSTGQIIVFQKGADRVAFYFYTGKDGKECSIKDVVALPRKGPRDKLLFCSIQDTSAGFGVRLEGRKQVSGYWDVTPDGKLERMPLGVLGSATTLHCSEPETGE